MNCPSCESTRVRKASTVYEAGTRVSTQKTRGSGVGLGISRRSKGIGAGFGGSRGVGRSSSVAAQKADKARIVWWGPTATFGLFIILSVVFVMFGLKGPFGTASALAIGVMVGLPVITGVLAMLANSDYDRRWYCDACGALWTHDENSAPVGRAPIVDPSPVQSQFPAPITWMLLPPDDAEKNKVSVFGKCDCGELILYDEDWPDHHIVKCEKCGTEFGDYKKYKSDAARFVAEFMARF